MRSGLRQARVRALAKINLSLKVLHRRADGYHEIRTLFQTVSLADLIEIEFAPARASGITVRSDPEIPDNIAGRAAALVLEAMGRPGRVEIRIEKRIPMGAGLGGGSSDAAAVLLALPALAGKPLDTGALFEIAGKLGSDVPFFLAGGAALGLGRGQELYPAPEPAGYAVIVQPAVHVSTAEAYRALARPLTPAAPDHMISSFQSWTWSLAGGVPPISRPAAVGENDFEPVVFAQYPRLKSLKRRLERMGAQALMSGSGSAMFGIFPSRAEAERARRSFRENTFTAALVSRRRYRSLWWRWLEPHIAGRTWPPASRYR